MMYFLTLLKEKIREKNNIFKINLLEKADSQYELYRILENYYGRDIEYYTIDSSYSISYNRSIGCGLISMNSTTLSREEFINLAEIYSKSSTKEGAKILADNAGMIYDMGISNGINPELVFIRAHVEGYSPGKAKNNYWGMGCTNTGGYKACRSYSSLADGVAGFLSYISKFATLTDLVGEYAFLGYYWYNPSPDRDDYWSMGGCPYASSIYNPIPDRVREACSGVNTCLNDGNTTNCIATTEEDREAYAVYQSQSMVSARKTIFGLDADSCESNAEIGEPGVGNCTIYRQADSRWGGIKLGTSSMTIANSGCAVTSVAIAISCSGVEINDAALFNPGTFVTKMNATGGFDNGGNIVWSNNAIKYFAPGFTFVTREDLTGNNNEKINKVQRYISNNTSIILHFINEDHARGHYVVLKSISENNLIVYDPATGGVNTYNVNDLDRMVVYSY